ncbi:MAG TPA: DUF1361 domain-containing protein [Candidatus Saccharimonadales bacterium]
MFLKLLLRQQLAVVLCFAVFVGLLLFAIGVWRNQTYDYWYLMPNLLLSVIPLVAALWLKRLLRTKLRRHWLPITATIVWLLFLPNSFYIVTDFIHLPESSRVDIVQDIVMLMQFSLLGLLFGYISLYIVHQEILKRHLVQKLTASIVVSFVLLLCGFAIYIGRELRWNSWDILLHPLELAESVALRFAHPVLYPESWSMTLSFFVFLTSIYFVGRQLATSKRES